MIIRRKDWGRQSQQEYDGERHRPLVMPSVFQGRHYIFSLQYRFSYRKKREDDNHETI